MKRRRFPGDRRRKLIRPIAAARLFVSRLHGTRGLAHEGRDIVGEADALTAATLATTTATLLLLSLRLRLPARLLLLALLRRAILLALALLAPAFATATLLLATSLAAMLLLVTRTRLALGPRPTLRQRALRYHGDVGLRCAGSVGTCLLTLSATTPPSFGAPPLGDAMFVGLAARTLALLRRLVEALGQVMTRRPARTLVALPLATAIARTCFALARACVRRLRFDPRLLESTLSNLEDWAKAVRGGVAGQ